MKKLENVVPDIYALLEDLSRGTPLPLTEEEIDKVLANMKESIISWANPSKRNQNFTVRMSNIGKPDRQLWFEKRDTDTSSNIDGPTQIKFLYGHILEEIALMLVRMAGHEVTDEQKEVSVNGIMGHMDSKINGEVTGCIPFFKHFHTAVKSCSQGGVRGGAATLFYPVWHLEVRDLLVLKNNAGTDENRIRHLDYGVQFNGLMYKRFLEDGVITLFSPHEVPGLYDAFFEDQGKFEKLYLAYEQDETIRKDQVKARDLFTAFMKERANTGRIYLQNVDHSNTHSAFNPNKARLA